MKRFSLSWNHHIAQLTSATVVRRRHAAYYARLAEIVFAHFGPEQGVRDAQFPVVLAQELSNARAALQWAEERHEAELGLRLTGFARLWHVHGQMSEAERWLERMLALDLQAREQGEHTAPLTLRIERLYGLARTLVRHGKVEHGAEAAASEALQLAQSIDDHNGISNAFATLGMIAQASGKLDEAEVAFTEGYTHARRREQKGLMSRALVGLAEVARMRGDLAHATVLAEEALTNAQALGTTWDIPTILTLLGHLARELQHSAEAKARYREALALYRTGKGRVQLRIGDLKAPTGGVGDFRFWTGPVIQHGCVHGMRGEQMILRAGIDIAGVGRDDLSVCVTDEVDHHFGIVIQLDAIPIPTAAGKGEEVSPLVIHPCQATHL